MKWLFLLDMNTIPHYIKNCSWKINFSNILKNHHRRITLNYPWIKISIWTLDLLFFVYSPHWKSTPEEISPFSSTKRKYLRTRVHVTGYSYNIRNELLEIILYFIFGNRNALYLGIIKLKYVIGSHIFMFKIRTIKLKYSWNCFFRIRYKLIGRLFLERGPHNSDRLLTFQYN